MARGPAVFPSCMACGPRLASFRRLSLREPSLAVPALCTDAATLGSGVSGSRPSSVLRNSSEHSTPPCGAACSKHVT